MKPLFLWIFLAGGLWLYLYRLTKSLHQSHRLSWHPTIQVTVNWDTGIATGSRQKWFGVENGCVKTHA